MVRGAVPAGEHGAGLEGEPVAVAVAGPAVAVAVAVAGPAVAVAVAGPAVEVVDRDVATRWHRRPGLALGPQAVAPSRAAALRGARYLGVR